MNRMSLTEFKKLSSTTIKEQLPIGLMVDGEVVALVAAPSGVIVISDMVPAVQIQFRARAALIRSGMPKEAEVHAPRTIEPETFSDDELDKLNDAGISSQTGNLSKGK